MTRRRLTFRNFILIGIFIFSMLIFLRWQNNSIVVTESTVTSDKISTEFDGFKIAQVSDLHNKMFGKGQKYILDKITAIAPDIIVITGDLVDQRKYNLEKAMQFIERAVKIAPVYYVSGNHEAWSGNYETIKKSLLEAGVIVLDNQKIEINKGDENFSLYGVSDPDFLTSDYLEGTNATLLKEALQVMSSDSRDRFKILLSHRPELFNLYVDAQMDLVFTGHAHGGQIRLPFIGGLIAPDQGFFPKYTSGHFTKDITTMFVSRGLGNSIFPQRLFNRPEIVVVTLREK